MKILKRDCLDFQNQTRLILINKKTLNINLTQAQIQIQNPILNLNSQFKNNCDENNTFESKEENNISSNLKNIIAKANLKNISKINSFNSSSEVNDRYSNSC